MVMYRWHCMCGHGNIHLLHKRAIAASLAHMRLISDEDDERDERERAKT